MVIQLGVDNTVTRGVGNIVRVGGNTVRVGGNTVRGRW